MTRWCRALIAGALLVTVVAGGLAVTARPAAADHGPRFGIYYSSGGYRDQCAPYPRYGAYPVRRYYVRDYDYYPRYPRYHRHRDCDDDDD